MVQLKANSATAHFCMIFISIPYGAIKSFFFIARWIFFIIISIPYGAIKSIEQLQWYHMLGDFNSLWCN